MVSWYAKCQWNRGFRERSAVDCEVKTRGKLNESRKVYSVFRVQFSVKRKRRKHPSPLLPPRQRRAGEGDDRAPGSGKCAEDGSALEARNSKAAEDCRTPYPGGEVDASEVSSFQCSVFSGERDEKVAPLPVPAPLARGEGDDCAAGSGERAEKGSALEEGNSKAPEDWSSPKPGGEVDASEVSSFQCSVFSGKEETAGLTGVAAAGPADTAALQEIKNEKRSEPPHVGCYEKVGSGSPPSHVGGYQEEQAVALELRPYQMPVFWDEESGIVVLHWARQVGKSFTAGGVGGEPAGIQPGQAGDGVIEFTGQWRGVCAEVRGGVPEVAAGGV